MEEHYPPAQKDFIILNLKIKFVIELQEHLACNHAICMIARWAYHFSSYNGKNIDKDLDEIATTIGYDLIQSAPNEGLFCLK